MELGGHAFQRAGVCFLALTDMERLSVKSRVSVGNADLRSRNGNCLVHRSGFANPGRAGGGERTE